MFKKILLDKERALKSTWFFKNFSTHIHVYIHKTSRTTFAGNKPRPSSASSSRIETEEGMRNAFEKDWGWGLLGMDRRGLEDPL